MQAAFERGSNSPGIVTRVSPELARRVLLNHFDMDIPFAMNIMAVARRLLRKKTRIQWNARSKPPSKPSVR